MGETLTLIGEIASFFIVPAIIWHDLREDRREKAQDGARERDAERI